MKQKHDKFHTLLICAALALAVIIAFEPVRHNDFVNYDDDRYVTESPHIYGGITGESVLWAFTVPHYYMYHPLTSLSHMLDCELFGLNASGHHLMSLFFHLANTLLLFAVLKTMTGRTWLSVFVAAAFALHPLQVESVAWASERKNVLSTFFWLLTIAAYVRYSARPAVGRYLLVVLASACGLLSKPTVVTLPFSLLLLDFWPLQRIRWPAKKSPDDSPRPTYKTSSILWLIIEKIPLFILSAVLSVITYVVQKSGGAVKTGQHLTIDIRIANAIASYIEYIGKIFYPRRLAPFYPHPGETLGFIWPLLCLLILAAVSAIVIYLARRRRYLAFGWLWYLGLLVPVLGLIQSGGQALADRYLYLPSVGIFIIVGWAAAELFAKYKITLAAAAGIILAVLLLCTRTQIPYWKNNYTLYSHAVAVVEDNHVMENNYGDTLRKKGRFQEAIEHFDRAIQANPRYLIAYNNKGRAFLDLDKVDKAIEIFNQACRIDKNRYDTYNYLGLAYSQKDQLDLAVQNYEISIRLKPDYYQALNNLGIVLKAQGKIEQAVENWQKALKVKPDYPNAHYNLGLVRAREGKYNSAADHLEKTIKAKPDWPEAYYNLGGIYYRMGRVDLAVEHCAEALRLKPDYFKAGIVLAQILFQMERTGQALDCCYRVLQTEPNQPEVLSLLARFLASDNAKFQNTDEAVKFARRACDLTDYNQPELLETLAVAYAAAGKVTNAIDTLQKALELAVATGRADLAEQIRSRLQQYKADRQKSAP